MAVIEVRDLTIEYQLNGQWYPAIREIDLTIDTGQIHGLVGESGSGKSTLGLALMRYLPANARIASGSIRLDGDDLVHKRPDEMARIWGEKLSLVPQNPLAALNPSYPIGDQISEITRQHQGLSRKAAWDQAVEMLRRVKIADPHIVARRYPHQLSGGMLQRVTIAMALSTRPRLLVLDEPTTALDVTTQAAILDLFRDLIREQDAAALYISHDLATVAQLCDQITVLYSGEIMSTALIDRIFHAPLHPYTVGLLASIPRHIEATETRLPTIEGIAPSLTERSVGCVFAPRCPIALERCHHEKPLLEGADMGRSVRCHRWREILAGEVSVITPVQAAAVTVAPREGYVLRAESLEKSFDQPSLFDRVFRRRVSSVRAVDQVSLQIRARSTFGLVGESGSGKTTLARVIMALDPADAGDLTLLDLPLPRHLDQRGREALCNLQMVFQNPNDTLNPFLTIGQTLGRTIQRLDGRQKSATAIRARVLELLHAVRLPETYADRYPAELSGGEKQRVAIARAFAANPALVVADEPTSSLDVSVQAVILNLLKDLRAEQGASYLLISHDLDVVAYLSDWIAVMYLGQIMETGTPSQVYQTPSHPYTEALVSAIPSPDPSVKRPIVRLEGDVPSPRDLPTGCRFHTRCPRKLGAICEQQAPPMQDAGDGHLIRCHIPIADLVVLQTPQEQP